MRVWRSVGGGRSGGPSKGFSDFPAATLSVSPQVWLAVHGTGNYALGRQKLLLLPVVSAQLLLGASRSQQRKAFVALSLRETLFAFYTLFLYPPTPSSLSLSLTHLFLSLCSSLSLSLSPSPDISRVSSGEWYRTLRYEFASITAKTGPEQEFKISLRSLLRIKIAFFTLSRKVSERARER